MGWWWIWWISGIPKVIFIFSSRTLRFRSYSNPVISMCTAWTSSTNHHDRFKYVYLRLNSIATPEADLVAALDVAYTALGLLKPVCFLVLSAILNRTASLAAVFGPNLAISIVAITCYFWSKCLSTQTVPCGLQQWRVTGIITARDPKLVASNQPESWWDHVRITWRIACCSYGNVLVIPPKSIIIYPGHLIKVRKSCN